MEQNPILINGQTQKKAMPTKPQLWLLAGSILIGIAVKLWMENDYDFLYPLLWLIALAVFVSFNFKRALGNKTVLALIFPAVALCVILMFHYLNVELTDFTSLAIPTLLLTIGVFTTQEISFKREGKAVLGVLRAVFVKPFTAIGAYFRAYTSVFGGKKGEHAKHGWIGFAVGLPLVVVVLALLAGADAGMQKILGTWIDNINLWKWFWRVVTVFVSAMLFYSLFYNLTWGKKDADLLPVRQNWKFAGPGVVMMLLLAAYALFTYVQFTYLFGKTLPVDLTYSEYARDGFGQFLAVTLINFTLLGVSLVKSEQGKAIKALQTLLIAASLIVLASACWRMLLYVGAYGLTILRVLPLWLMAYFVFLAVVGVVRVYREQTPFLRIGAFALVYWYLLLICIDWNTVMVTFNQINHFGG